MPNTKHPDTQKTALVLSGGGVLGVAHIGAWEVLAKNNYTFDFLAGVSAGAIISSFIASGKDIESAKSLISKYNIFKTVFDFSRSNFGLISGKKIKLLLDNIFDEKTFEDLAIPLFIGTTDFQTGESVYITKGLIADAVRASISVPGFFEPYFHPTEKKWLVDGGLCQNLPIDLAIKKYKGTSIIGVDVATSINEDIDFTNKSFFSKPKHVTKSMFRTFRIMFKNQQTHFPDDNRVQIIRPDLGNYNSMDVLKINQIISQGRKATEMQLIQEKVSHK